MNRPPSTETLSCSCGGPMQSSSFFYYTVSAATVAGNKKPATELMKTTEPITDGANAEIKFYNVPSLLRCFGIDRSALYERLKSGEIRSITLRDKGEIRGKRLIEASSARAFFARQPDDVSPAMRAHMRRAGKLSAQAKREKAKAK